MKKVWHKAVISTEEQNVEIYPTEDFKGIIIENKELDGVTGSPRLYLSKDEMELLIITMQNMMKYVLENNINSQKDMRKFKPIKPFNENDWSHLHDCWIHVKGSEPTERQLENLFSELSGDLKFIAEERGMNDTEFREGVIEWITSNEFTEV